MVVKAKGFLIIRFVSLRKMDRVSGMMDGSNGLLNIKNVSLVTMLAAASAAAIYLLKTPQKVTDAHAVEEGGEGTGPDAKKPLKSARRRSQNIRAVQSMVRELQKRREDILKQFEESQHKSMPQDMTETMEFIEQLDIEAQPPQIRLLCSQLIQDYTIMYTNVFDSECHPKVVELAKRWLEFDYNACDTDTRIEQINHRYALALRSRKMKEFTLLFQWLLVCLCLCLWFSLPPISSFERFRFFLETSRCR